MMNFENSILIAGGYGVVGQQIAEVIRANNPELPIVIAGRNPEKGQALADSLGNASVLSLNMEQSNPLKNLKVRAVLAAVNDPNDFLLIDAIQKGIPYLDITRWTERLREAVEVAKKANLKAPVLFSSAWMAGVAAVVTRELTKDTKSINNIDISVLYSLKDKAGPNSTEYMDRLATPFEVISNGESKQVYPYTDPKKITFPSGYSANAYRFDTPDQFTLPKTTNARTVSARIAFDDAMSTWLLVMLTRSGLWKLVSGERFKSLRRSILFNPGKGANHEIVIEAQGTDHAAKPVQLRATILAPKGQTHLTAVGAAIQLDRLLGLDGASAPSSSIVFPDTAPQTSYALSVLGASGIEVKIESLT
jgi:saccharopine dehydrogenase-like NADP-dependent oxidoreductase